MRYFNDAHIDPYDPTSPPILDHIRAVARWFGAFARAFAGRRVLTELGRLDDRTLRDIGLTRSDLRDAASLPSLSDPTALLFDRVRERRMTRGTPGGRRFLSDV